MKYSQRILGPTLILALGTFGICQETSPSPEKGSVIKIEKTAANVPGDWKEEVPSNSMRAGQFKLPGAEGKDGEVVLFKGLGGGIPQNIKRWKDTFPDGESKETDVKIAGLSGKRLDISGTYMFKAAPFNPNSKSEPRAGYKMTAIYLEGETPYQIRMVGPAKTIEKYQSGFDGLVKSFK
ncbi:MAG: hypothetical protein EXS11_01875 [Gemmataceae bacterium]|nr:hypothetical protein [Gemmataceae bacterium]